MLQRLFTSITNACIYIVVDACNATYSHHIKSVGVDHNNAYMDISQRIDALLKGVPVVVL
jgi:hypothetical protein